MAFFIGGSVGRSKTAPAHQMLKAAAHPVPSYDVDPVSGMLNVLCVIVGVAPIIRIILRCIQFFWDFLDSV